MHREDDHDDAREVRLDPAGRLDAVHDGHADVEEHDVGPQFGDQGDGLCTVDRFAHHLDHLILLENLPRAATHKAVVVGDEDCRRCCHEASSLSPMPSKLGIGESMWRPHAEPWQHVLTRRAVEASTRKTPPHTEIENGVANYGIANAGFHVPAPGPLCLTATNPTRQHHVQAGKQGSRDIPSHGGPPPLPREQGQAPLGEDRRRRPRCGAARAGGMSAHDLRCSLWWRCLHSRLRRESVG